MVLQDHLCLSDSAVYLISLFRRIRSSIRHKEVPAKRKSASHSTFLLTFTFYKMIILLGAIGENASFLETLKQILRCIFH